MFFSPDKSVYSVILADLLSVESWAEAKKALC